jgi:hypothetical protein
VEATPTWPVGLPAQLMVVAATAGALPLLPAVDLERPREGDSPIPGAGGGGSTAVALDLLVLGLLVLLPTGEAAVAAARNTGTFSPSAVASTAAAFTPSCSIGTGIARAAGVRTEAVARVGVVVVLVSGCTAKPITSS